MIDQRDDHAGLARAGRHDSERVALMPCLERGIDRADGVYLVGALDDGPVDRRLRQGLPGRASEYEERVLVLGEEALHLSRWIPAGLVPEPGLEPVAVEHNRSLPELSAQAVGVELGLLLAG